MPTVRIPLVGVANPRTIDGQATVVAGQDQRLVNCTFDVVKDPITGQAVAYVEKRPGWGVESIVSAGNISTGLMRTDSIESILSAFGDTNSTIYDSQISVGAITGRALHFSETLISGVGYILIKSSDGTGWYYAENARDQLSYTGDTHTNTTIDGIASTAGMYSGQAISGSGIQAGTRISSVDSSTAITVDTATTATAAGVTITKTPIAKILDTDFITSGSFISKFAEMDGFLFYSTDDGYLRNSDLNNLASYPATGKLAVQMSPDKPIGVVRNKHTILCFGTDSIEVFRNPGNPAGSPLARVADVNSKVGALDQRSIAEIEDDIYFATSSRDGDVMIKKLPGLETVSTPAVSKMLGTISADARIYMSAFGMGGYHYLSAYVTTGAIGGVSMLLLETGDNILLETGDDILAEGSSSETSYFARHLVYNTNLRVWSEWDSNIPTFIVGQGAGATNQLIATSRVNTGGKVYTINPASDGELYTDEGSAYTMSITTMPVDHGTNRRKTVTAVRLVCDQQESGTATLSYSDDGYESFTEAGTFDLTEREPMITRLGAYQGGRVYRLEHSSDAPFRAQALEIDYAVGR
jgi:hypothetical protein